MSFSHALYQLLIRPLELIFEIVYCFAKYLSDDPGISIFALSLVMNVLLLPLYRRADAIQDEERAVQKRMSGWVAHIKKTFSGNERFLMLQAYYRQNNYKPFYALRGSLPLLLEIPFFIAAYHFLSNLTELRGMPFGPIDNLGAPDGLIRIGGLQINLLPVLMTVINGISSAIYTKGLPLKDKLQLYGMALVFLVLLYGSPSGLVLYWTLNNLFSLLKNLYYKLKNPKRVLRIALAAAGGLLLIFTLFFYETSYQNTPVFLCLIAVALELPLLWHLLKKCLPQRRSLGSRIPEARSGKAFLLGSLLLTTITGAMIPAAVIRSSPAEFVLSTHIVTPAWHVLDAVLLAGGLFVIWFGIFYFLASKKARWIFGLVIWVICGFGIVNYMFFGTNLGTLSNALKFEEELSFDTGDLLLNSGLVLLLIALLGLIWAKLPKLVPWVTAVLIAGAAVLAITDLSEIRKEFPEIKVTLEENLAQQRAQEQEQKDPTEGISFRLSTTGDNVIVLMLDRAISAYIPYMFAEKPELAEMFDGFTYYPNTVSFGGHTNLAAPALFGGYEYTPAEMNKRDTESLASKHDEALKLMPTLFGSADYEVTLFDPPYAGYQWTPRLSVFNGTPIRAAFITEDGRFNRTPEQDPTEDLSACWSRNFFCYSFMKIAPLVLQDTLYQGGNYGAADPNAQTVSGLSTSVGYDMDFVNSFSVLQALPELTEVTDEPVDTFLMMQNGATHENTLLQEPEYLPAAAVDNRGYDKAHAGRFTLNGRTMKVENERHMSHYQVNMAALLQVGRWLNTLREQGVYDNTRIIIVSDHGGAYLQQFDDWLFGDEVDEDVMYYNPLFMVKDFGASGFTTDNRFMTNADVPSLALDGLIENPTNPFTGKPINTDAKNDPVQYVSGSHVYQLNKNNGNTFVPGIWYSVHDDIFNMDNWEILDEH